VQIEFNPRAVASYRLIGYENRLMANRDFEDDHEDAGELGAGHSVTAIYEIVPASGKAAARGELATVRIRFKLPGAAEGHELAVPVADRDVALPGTSDDYRFAAATAAFGFLLRNSPAHGSATWSSARALAAGAIAGDRQRADMLRLLDLAARLAGPPAAVAVPAATAAAR